MAVIAKFNDRASGFFFSSANTVSASSRLSPFSKKRVVQVTWEVRSITNTRCPARVAQWAMLEQSVDLPVPPLLFVNAKTLASYFEWKF